MPDDAEFEDPDFQLGAELGADAEAMAKAIVLSMLNEHDPSHPGPATMDLIKSLASTTARALAGVDIPEETIEGLVRSTTWAATVAGMIAQIAAGIIRGAEAQGVVFADLREQLSSPYSLPDLGYDPPERD